MHGKGRWIGNIFIERLWRSVKYEDVYLRAYASASEAHQCLTRYFALYNARRARESLRYATPDDVHLGALAAGAKAAALRCRKQSFSRLPGARLHRGGRG